MRALTVETAERLEPSGQIKTSHGKLMLILISIIRGVVVVTSIFPRSTCSSAIDSIHSVKTSRLLPDARPRQLTPSGGFTRTCSVGSFHRRGA